VSGEPPAAILDIDGTLVDTNYHHAVAWFRAFRQHGFVLPLWRIHRHIGMGGDQLVAALAGEGFDERHGDEVRGAEKALYKAMIDEVEPLAGARELIEELKGRGHTARELAAGWTTSADVRATKPEPDLIQAAMEKAQTQDGVMIGRLDVGLRGREAGGARDHRRADRWLLGEGAARRGRRGGLPLGARAGRAPGRHAAGSGRAGPQGLTRPQPFVRGS
jgi:beta-phosphoglucomutase-like phosphatase (HAD superfamily)